MVHPALTYPEAIVVGLIQGVTELFPVSSLGHNVLIPALIGGSWQTDLNVAAKESPYLAFIVGLHVATAIGITAYFWRDWLRIIGGFFTSFRQLPPRTADQKLAWMIVLATIPVGIAGLAFEHAFRVLFGKPILAAVFLVVNGIILFGGERFRTRQSRDADERLAQPVALEPAGHGSSAGPPWSDAAQGSTAAAPPAAPPRAGGAHSSGHRAIRQQEIAAAIQADQRLASAGYLKGTLIGSAQILALLAGISRDGVTMVAGMFGGLSRQDAARFAFLLATPVILAAGVLKIGDLFGPLGNGIHGQVLAGSIVSGVGAYLSVRFLMKFFQTRTLTPFAIYCLVFGLASIAYLKLK
jgi:undecaprenyl-diphosphatase